MKVINEEIERLEETDERNRSKCISQKYSKSWSDETTRKKKKTIYTVKHNYLAKSSYNCLLESPKRSLSWNGSVSVSILGHLH